MRRLSSILRRAVAWMLCLTLLASSSLRPVTAAPSPAPAAQETCKSVDPVCMAQLNQNAKVWAAKPWDDIVSAVLNCTGMSTDDARTRILMGNYSLANWNQVSYIADTFVPLVKRLSGIVLQADFAVPSALAARVMDLAETGRGYYAVWALSPHMIPDLWAQNRIAVLDGLVMNDRSLDWLDVHKFIRSQNLYNGSITAVPIVHASVLMYYRRDHLSAAKLPVPATWDDLVMVAQALNGTDLNNDGKPDYAMCLMIAGEYCDGRDASWIIEAILASYTQVRGLSSGWMFDPDTITSFADTEAMRNALDILAKLVALSWPSSSCSNISPDFMAGRCAITIGHDGTFTGIQKRRAPSILKGTGRLGLVSIPGSGQVLDRSTGKLTECTSTSQCPYATPQYSLALNKTVLVNNAPVNVPVATMVVNHDAPQAFQPIISQLMTLMTSPEQVQFVMFSTDGMGGPIRYKTLATDSKSLALWQAYGCNISEVKEYLNTVSGILDHPNIAGDFRVLRGHHFRDHLQQAAFQLGNYTPPSNVYTWLSQQFAATLNSVPKRQFAEAMWLGLNLQRTWQEPSPPPATPSGITSFPGDRGSSTATATILAVAVPIGTVALLLAVAGAWAVKRGWVKLGPSGPPKAGPQSTLVVTDVEDSTVLWETLPMGAMDQAIRLHHTLIRKLMATYHGYESATEGDSFIMAFHTAGDALNFCFSLQKQLMEQPWPQEILDHKPTAPVRVIESAATMPNPSTSLKQDALQAFDLQQALDRPEQQAGAKELLRTTRTTLPNGSAQTGTDAAPRLRLLIQQLGNCAQAPQTVLESLRHQWTLEDNDAEVPSATAGLTAYRGMRLRLGFHSGLTDEDIVVNKTNGGIQYTGHALTVAKAVADSGQGGMVLMTLAAFEVVKNSWGSGKHKPGPHLGLRPSTSKVSENSREPYPLILHVGSYSFLKAPDIQPCEVYLAVPEGLDCRLAVGRTDLRNTTQLASGVLQAPVGQASVVFCTMVGYQTLLSWNKDLALDALAMYNDTATRLLASTGGEGHYLLEMADGLCLCVFSSAASAILWGLRVVEAMKHLDWAEELLAHELCENVMVSVTADPELHDDAEEATILFNGPRVKVGVDFGDVTCDVSPATARLAYRGRPMNRAARVMDKVPSGQVWCTEAAWEYASEDLANGGIRGKEMGVFPMKGLSQALKLYNCAQPMERQGHGTPCAPQLSLRKSAYRMSGRVRSSNMSTTSERSSAQSSIHPAADLRRHRASFYMLTAQTSVPLLESDDHQQVIDNPIASHYEEHDGSVAAAEDVVLDVPAMHHRA